ncbi:hypothetical protein K435DRAFT_349746 [Dendrothele bispora CBS 962.96]|uniref:Uncharacterized protein n=1 Tax=Dendrothele bispora (strain CBS 962.96) TaxID=1314807 RepID=A0A4S8LDU7_DENBC|nr:hypothetical protein K435DRAFT_349746 [Dendrothele bispora CBS 962.96]
MRMCMLCHMMCSAQSDLGRVRLVREHHLGYVITPFFFFLCIFELGPLELTVDSFYFFFLCLRFRSWNSFSQPTKPVPYLMDGDQRRAVDDFVNSLTGSHTCKFLLVSLLHLYTFLFSPDLYVVNPMLYTRSYLYLPPTYDLDDVQRMEIMNWTRWVRTWMWMWTGTTGLTCWSMTGGIADGMMGMVYCIDHQR